MRDLIVTIIVLGTLPAILMHPYIGVLAWSWIGYMNPHRLSWGFAQDFPFAMLIALFTLAGLMISREPKKIPWTRESRILMVLILWMVLTTFFSFYPEHAWLQLEKVIKIQLMIFITLVLMTNRERIDKLVWIIVFSLGFYGVKGGLFTLLTGGGFHVRGPLGTFIGGNNEIGLALIMIVPLMRYLQLQMKRQWAKLAMYGAMGLTVIAILGTQSRGALLGLTAMLMFMVLKSRKKLLLLILIALMVPVGLIVMPDTWKQRMHTIESYEVDKSVQGRFTAWQYAYDTARDNPLGGGFEAFLGRTDAHSIYFEMLGEHGFVGLGLFLLLALLTWMSGSWVIRATRKNDELNWLRDLASMLQVSMVGYASAGAFLGLAYFDLYYHIIALMILCKVIAVKYTEEESAVETGDQPEEDMSGRNEPHVYDPYHQGPR